MTYRAVETGAERVAALEREEDETTALDHWL